MLLASKCAAIPKVDVDVQREREDMRQVNTSKPRRAECDGSGDGSGGVVVWWW
jgi:hypothetical protein